MLHTEFLSFLSSVLPLKIKKESKCFHYLYVKEHSVRESIASKPKDKTLFVLNIPPYCEMVSLNIPPYCESVSKYLQLTMSFRTHV